MNDRERVEWFFRERPADCMCGNVDVMTDEFKHGLAAEFAAVRAEERERYVAALRLAVEAMENNQYADNSGEEYTPTCPDCHSSIGRKHAKGCQLAAALAACRKVVEP